MKRIILKFLHFFLILIMTSCGGKNRNAHDIEQANLVERVEALEGRVEILVQQLEIMKAKESAKQSGFDVREIEGKK